MGITRPVAETPMEFNRRSAGDQLIRTPGGNKTLTDHAAKRRRVQPFATATIPGEQAPGMSAFALADGVVYHTYSAYARGVEQLMGTYRFLDLAPLGRNEQSAADWWRRHDEYDSE